MWAAVSRGSRSGRINKVHRIQDLQRRPIDQLAADCLRHSEVPMGIITKSGLRQNYCITGDKLRRFTLTITAAPPAHVQLLLTETVASTYVSLGLKERQWTNHQGWLWTSDPKCQTCNNRPELHNDLGLIFVFVMPCWIFVEAFYPPNSSWGGNTPTGVWARGRSETDKDENPPRETPPGEWSHLVDFSPRGHHSDGAALATHLIIIHILCATAP